MQNLKKRTIAVASGKGGVGKTTTCVNLAVFFARRGLKTAILDLDPLSDVATLLDIKESEAILEQPENGAASISALPNLDIVFPASTEEKRSSRLFTEVTGKAEDLVSRYDKIILDLPAGSLYEENLVFLDLTDNLLIVTNDEPTSHTASGSYIKKAVEAGKKPNFLLWHNKYSGITTAGFDPSDLPGNYNANVPEEERFDFTRVKLSDAAYIPHDPAMDLLQSYPSLAVNILGQISERIDFLLEQRINELAFTASLPEYAGSLIRHFIHLNPDISDLDAYFEELSAYIYVLLDTSVLSSAGSEYHGAVKNGAVELFTGNEKKAVLALLTRIKDDKLTRELVETAVLINRAVNEQENSGRMFFVSSETTSLKSVDRKLSILLQKLHSERNNHNAYIKNTAGLLLFDFTIHKLLASRTVSSLITDFIPVRKNSRGESVRDKNRQILRLVSNDTDYKKSFVKLINALFPVVLKQMGVIVETFGLPGLVFRNSGSINKPVYLKLMSTFLHNAVNSGLGVVVGFPFRPASSAFEKGAEKLLKK